MLQRLDNILDRISQLLYLTGHQDPSGAPQTPRPVLPHEARRKQLRKRQLRRLTENFD